MNNIEFSKMTSLRRPRLKTFFFNVEKSDRHSIAKVRTVSNVKLWSHFLKCRNKKNIRFIANKANKLQIQVVN